MAGLGGQGVPPRQMEAQGGAAAPSGMGGGLAPEMQSIDDTGADVTEASPEEQALYNRFVAMAVMGLSDEQNLTNTIKAMQSAGDPTVGVAEVASAMIVRVSSMARSQGNELPGDVLMHGGKEIIEYAVELAEAAGLAEFSPEMMEQTFYQTLDLVTQSMKDSGELDEEAIAADLPRMKQAEESGELDSILAQIQAQQSARPADDLSPSDGMTPPEEGM